MGLLCYGAETCTCICVSSLSGSGQWQGRTAALGWLGLGLIKLIQATRNVFLPLIPKHSQKRLHSE